MWFFKKKTDIDNTPLDKLNEIDDEDTRERLLVKSVKTLNEKVNNLEEEKQTKLLYRFPVQLCNHSLFYIDNIKCINIIDWSLL